jgi:RES domain-containing protein
MIRAWRIVTLARIDSALDGTGAKRNGGRWNPVGVPMVYTAGSLALAAMEMLVHLESEELLGRYIAIPVDIPPLLIEQLPAGDLPPDWRDDPIPRSSQALGARWVKSTRSAVLAVPSTVIPQEFNYLLNPEHAAFKAIETGTPTAFDYDPRLLKQ